MAHEVETMAYFGQLPWHGLGTALDEADLYDWPAASKKAGLDWDVELVPLVTADTQAKVDHRAVRRTSDAKVLGVVGPRYARPPEPGRLRLVPALPRRQGGGAAHGGEPPQRQPHLGSGQAEP